MQEGLLFRSVFLPESDLYLNQNILELSGALNEELLRAAWQSVLNHYEVLRTSFRWQGLHEPLQLVMRQVAIPWQSHDWRDVPQEALESRTEELLAADRRNSFDLSHAPLLRLQCVRVAEDCWRLLWTHHHILIDGWCLSLIWGNLFKLYEQLQAGEPPQLPAVRPYRDYIRWLRAQSQSEATEFWRRYLDGFDTPSRFTPADNYLPSEYKTEIVRLSEKETAALTQLARSTGVTLSGVIQAAWALLLFSECRHTDLVFGISVSGRPPQLEGSAEMVGLFINTLPLRIRLDDRTTPRDLLRTLHSDYSNMAFHGYLPLAVIKTLAAAPAGKPIFDSLIAFENYPEDSLPAEQAAGITIRDLVAHEKTEYPVGLIVLPESRLALHFNYDTALFLPSHAARLIRRFLHILDRIRREPDERLLGLPLLPEAEEQTVTKEWSGVARSYEPAANARELFERQAEQRPDALAVVDGARSWTYREVEMRANRMAHRLLHAGVMPGSRVVVGLPRSVELIVTMLAVWKAGAIYTPVDVSQPLERRRWMIAESEAGALVVREPSEAELLGFTGPVLVEEQPDITADVSRPAASGEDAGVAYMMFTSGTTGHPKGVLCTHAGLVNRVQWSLEACALGASDVVLHNAAAGFDIAIWEVLGPLAAGAQVVVLEEGRQRDVGALIEEIDRHRVTVMHLVPSLLGVMLEHPEVSRCGTLREVITGGEVTPVALWVRMQQRLPWVGMQQAYGPTEATISVTCWECRRGEDVGRIPLGRPIANVRVYVLDQWLRPVPAGVLGELYIGGVAVAAGYWKQEELTREKFVANPFEKGEKLYRTGDWGRWLDGGVLEYEGRRDRQVKVRGQRVELGEVEWVLGEMAGVRQAAVDARTDGNGELILIGWVASSEVTEQGLQRELRGKLPEHMIPSRIVVVERFSLTANGKIDRHALPDPSPGVKRDPRNAMPQTPTQAGLWNIWKQLLNTGEFGIHDNFFELGGHSLLAIRFAVRAEQEFGAGALNITHIFKNPTIAALAAIVEKKLGAGSPLFAISEESGALPPVLLVHPGEGLTYAYRALAGRLEGVPLWAINNPRFGDQEHPFRSVEEMAAEYLEHVRRQFGTRRYILGGWSFGGVVAFEMARQLQAAGQGAIPPILIDSYYLPRLESQPAEQSVRQLLAATGIRKEKQELGPFLFELMTSGAMALRYRPEPFDGRVLLVKAQEAEVRWSGHPAAEHNGWLDLARGGIEVYPTPGAHSELFDAAHIPSTAAAVQRAIETVQRTSVAAGI